MVAEITSDVAFSPDGRTLYEVRGGSVAAFDLSSGAMRSEWSVRTRLGGIDVSRDGRYLVATEQQKGTIVSSGTGQTTEYFVYRLDLNSGASTKFTSLVGDFYASNYHDAAFLPDGMAILTQDYSGSGWVPLTTLDFSTGTFARSQETYSQAGILTSSADQSRILFGPQNNSTAPLFIHAESGITASHGGYADNVIGFNRGVQAVSTSKDLVVQSIHTGLHVYDAELNHKLNLQDRHPNFEIVGLAFSPSGDTLYVLDARSDTVHALGTADWNVQASYRVNSPVAPPSTFGRDFGDTLRASPDGRFLSVLADAQVRVIDRAPAAGGGADLVITSVNTVLSSEVERLTLTGVDNVSGQGNALANVIIGNAGNNTLSGMDGNDTLSGGGGNDRLAGGADSDSLSGGDGADTLAGGFGADTLSGGAGSDRFEGTLAELNGDRVVDFSIGDSIRVIGATAGTLAFTRVRTTLSFGSDRSIDIGAADLQLVVRPSGANAAELVAVQRATAPADFNGDGHSDILWRNTNGALSTWSVSGDVRGDQIQQNVFNAYLDPSERIAETFDFDGNGLADILWRSQGGAISVWTGSYRVGFQPGAYTDSSVGDQWRIAATGDFNGDGRDDILWQDTGGAISTWSSTGSSFVQNSYYHGSVGGAWKVAGAGDVDGDGRGDIVWRNDNDNDNGAVSVWMATESGFAEGSYFEPNVPSSWHIDGLADLSGDGRADILWRNDNGAVSTWLSNGRGFDQNAFYAQVGNDWRIASTGDFNADGRADVLWHNTNGALSTWQSNGAGFDENIANAAAPTSWNIVGHDFPL